MNVFTIKAVDKYVGAPLCCLLCLFKKEKILPVPKRILFIQLWGIGETILTLPAIKAVREKFPDASISVLATGRNKAVYENLHYINDIIELKTSPFAIISFIAKNASQYDVAVDMEEYLNISALLCFFTGIHRIGFDGRMRSGLYDARISYNDKQHVAMTFLDLAKKIGVKGRINTLERLAIDKDTKLIVQKLFRLYKISQKDFLIGFGTGSAESSHCRKWMKERYARLADLLIERYNAKIIFLGSEEEANEIDSIINLMKRDAVNLAGKTSVRQLFGVIEKLALFIGNDSGPMHIASAQGVKTIGLFGPNIPARFGPFGKQNEAIYRGDVCEFSPCINVHLGQVPDCLYPKNSDDYQKCMKNIGVEDVLQTIKKVVRK